MIQQLFFIFWFFLPAGIANTVPVIAAKIPFLRDLSYPVDCYKDFRGQRVLGDHKTIRGFVIGILCSILTVFFQQYFYSHTVIHNIISLNYTQLNAWVLGILMGLGGLGGDSAKSFVKRRIHIKPGSTWFPFDQLDYIIGAILLTCFYIRLTLFQYVIALFMWFILHLATALLGYVLKLKKDPI